MSLQCCVFLYSVAQALRLVLHTISTSAARYGRYIQPLLSLSIDFYVRLFIRVQSAPIEVKKAAMYVPSSVYRSVFTNQHLTMRKGKHRHITYVQDANHSMANHWVKWSKSFMSHLETSTSYLKHMLVLQCPRNVRNVTPCYMLVRPTWMSLESSIDSCLQQMAGPMWSGPIHDSEFVTKVLEHLADNVDKYGTSTRMKGMLTVAKEVSKGILIPSIVVILNTTLGAGCSVLFYSIKNCQFLSLHMPSAGRYRVSVLLVVIIYP